MYVIDYMIEKGLKKTESRLFKSWNAILYEDVNADIIIMGNSRAYRNFDPKNISSMVGETVWNLGMDSYSFNIQQVKYSIYRKYNAQPKTLLINVDYATLDYSEVNYEREQFLPYINDSAFQNKSIQNAFSSRERYFPLIKYFGYRSEIIIGLLEFLNIRHFNDDEVNGYWGSMGLWNENGLKHMVKNHKTIQAANNEKVVSEFKKFITEKKADSVKIVLVYSPLYKDASQVLKDNKLTVDLYKALSDELGVAFIDYTNDEMCEDITCFENATHLNRKGAELFSLKLGKYLSNCKN